MNVEVMNKLADLIEYMPEERFNMSGWFSRIVNDSYNDDWDDDDGFTYHYISGYEPINFRDCGTAACIAGWAVAMNEKDLFDIEPNESLTMNYMVKEVGDVPTIAAEILGLEIRKAERLFYFGDQSIWYEFGTDNKYGIEFHNCEACDSSCDVFGDSCSYRRLRERSITNKIAANVLREIAKGEIIL